MDPEPLVHIGANAGFQTVIDGLHHLVRRTGRDRRLDDDVETVAAADSIGRNQQRIVFQSHFGRGKRRGRRFAEKGQRRTVLDMLFDQNCQGIALA